MNVALPTPWTQERFFPWAQNQRERYEFDGTRPVLMTGGGAGHALITTNVLMALRTRLRGSPYQALGPDAGVETIGKTIRYPDAVVTGTKFKLTDYLIPGAVVLFEVLSPTPGRTVRIIKVREYAAIPTVRRYVIVESVGVGLTVLDRPTEEDPWRSTALAAGDTLAMPELGIEIPVAEFYDGINFEDDNPTPETA